MLDIRLLGPLLVYKDDELITIPRRVTRAFLSGFYLVFIWFLIFGDAYVLRYPPLGTPLDAVTRDPAYLETDSWGEKLSVSEFKSKV